MIVPVASARAVAPAVTILGRQLSAEKAVAVFSVFIAAVGAALFGFVGLLIGGGVGFAAGCLAAYFRKEAPV